MRNKSCTRKVKKKPSIAIGISESPTRMETTELTTENSNINNNNNISNIAIGFGMLQIHKESEQILELLIRPQLNSRSGVYG